MATTLTWTPRAKEQLNKVLNDLYEISSGLSESWTDELDKKLALLADFPEMGRLVPKHELYFLSGDFSGTLSCKIRLPD